MANFQTGQFESESKSDSGSESERKSESNGECESDSGSVSECKCDSDCVMDIIDDKLTSQIKNECYLFFTLF